jgi:hypothetical protein
VALIASLLYLFASICLFLGYWLLMTTVWAYYVPVLSFTSAVAGSAVAPSASAGAAMAATTKMSQQPVAAMDHGQMGMTSDPTLRYAENKAAPTAGNSAATAPYTMPQQQHAVPAVQSAV